MYTFGIDSNLFGKSTEKWNEKTKELIKVEEGEYQWVETEKESGIFTTTTALEGATFTLTNNKTKNLTRQHLTNTDILSLQVLMQVSTHCRKQMRLTVLH